MLTSKQVSVLRAALIILFGSKYKNKTDQEINEIAEKIKSLLK